MSRPVAISIFSGIGGLDLGLDRAGFEVRVQVDIDDLSIAALKANFPQSLQIHQDVQETRPEELLRGAGIDSGELDLLAAGFPCQPFSTIGRRGSLRDPRGQLFYHVCRLIQGTTPRHVVLENVRGILSAARRHRPLDHRGPNHPPLRWDEKPGSALRHMMRQLKELGYTTTFELVNAADLGVPQKRHRVLLVASRDDQQPFEFPGRTHGVEAKAHVTLGQALEGLREPGAHEVYGPEVSSVFEQVPAGGCWKDLPKSVAKKAMGLSWHAGGGKTGFFRRLSFDAPAPTITGRPAGKATGFCHPDETRPLSINEWRRVQQFPDKWHQEGALTRRYTQVGNAVPVGLGRWIGSALANAA